MHFEHDSIGSPARRRLRLHRFILGLLGLTGSALVVVEGCVYDASERCGERQVYLHGICTCAEGYGQIDGVCQKCGENERGDQYEGCVCAEGYARPSASEPCQKVEFGKTCKADEDCGGGDLVCHLVGDEGYCTTIGCTRDSDCIGQFYRCNLDEEPSSYCERPPVGERKPCASQNDCAGQEADYCEVVTRKYCVESGCASDPSVCFVGYICCDIGVMRKSLCIDPKDLPDGQCPAGGTLIPLPGDTQ